MTVVTEVRKKEGPPKFLTFPCKPCTDIIYAGKENKVKEKDCGKKVDKTERMGGVWSFI